jgi:hypothetical protein
MFCDYKGNWSNVGIFSQIDAQTWWFSLCLIKVKLTRVDVWVLLTCTDYFPGFILAQSGTKSTASLTNTGFSLPFSDFYHHGDIYMWISALYNPMFCYFWGKTFSIPGINQNLQTNKKPYHESSCLQTMGRIYISLCRCMLNYIIST